MNNREAIQLGAGRYIQYYGALDEIGSEASSIGRKAYILGDETTLAKVMKKMGMKLQQAGVDYAVRAFDEPAVDASFEQIAQEVRESGADVIIGVGGGKTIDIAKAASDLTDVKIITVPTSSATCASYAVLYVAYNENGSVNGSRFMHHEVSAVIVDLEIVQDDCPPRYFASGIADAMAKNPEIMFTMIRLGTANNRANTDAATVVAKYTYDNYLEKAQKAYEAFVNGEHCDLVEDIVCCNIMLTGLVSNLSTGGKQLALAHNFYDAVCCMYKEVRRQYLHGELVGLGIPLQLGVNGVPQEEIEAIKKFLASIHLPVTLEEIGISTDDATLEKLTDYILNATDKDDLKLRKAIRANLKYML
ncbi:iron-containing alcohol dehydrogenase [Clostridium sp. KNHs216]|uniref:iron-containing alcohol dehydrogenase n=1 Tax=Clostridium sp. KNHs216 TaxID=1550235 RepID=UPI001150ECFE|nr:iron-containing alcohol dehydrogenase [Clostridium sp. KNHs216]TQI66845.1 glycerol dehydrogenase [Clostridium sp. KNHs216]